MPTARTAISAVLPVLRSWMARCNGADAACAPPWDPREPFSAPGHRSERDAPGAQGLPAVPDAIARGTLLSSRRSAACRIPCARAARPVTSNNSMAAAARARAHGPGQYCSSWADYPVFCAWPCCAPAQGSGCSRYCPHGTVHIRSYAAHRRPRGCGHGRDSMGRREPIVADGPRAATGWVIRYAVCRCGVAEQSGSVLPIEGHRTSPLAPSCAS